MFSRSSLCRFTPWQFALNTIKKSHETLTWPSPESSCKILFDTPDMPPQLKLILYFMLRSRHLLICTTTSTNPRASSSSSSSSSSAPSTSPIASTFKAYSSALKAANEISHLSGFSRYEFPLIATLNGDSWFGANDDEENSNSNKSSNSSIQQMWIPLPLQKAKKAGGKYQSLMQPKISSQFAHVISTGARDETNSKLFGGFHDRNKKRTSQNFMPQAKVQPSKQIAKLAAISSVARIRFAETPSLLAEVWSNILSDGLFDSMVIQVRTGGTSSTTEVDQKHQEQILVAVSDVLSSLFASRDHLLFNEKILDQVTSLALELLTCLQQYHLANEVGQDNGGSSSEKQYNHSNNNKLINPKIAFAFSELCAHLAASLRLRGGCTTAASKMSEFLLLAHHLSLREARYQNVFRHVTLPNEKEVVLPLKICFELFQILRVKSNNFFDVDDDENNNNHEGRNDQKSVLMRGFYEKSVQVVREEQTAVKERREKNFEEKLQEIAQVAEALGKNPKNEQLLLTQKKREEHLREVVLRDQQISKKISQAVDIEIAKIGKLVENNSNKKNIVNSEKKSTTKKKSSKTTTSPSLDFYWSWNLDPANEDDTAQPMNDEKSHQDDSSIQKTTRKFGLTNVNNFVEEQETSPVPSAAEVKDEFDVDEDEDGNFISRVQLIQKQQETATGLSLQADTSYGPVKFDSSSSSSTRRVSESWIVSFHKSDIARFVELDPTASLPSSQLLFLRWLLQSAQRQEDNETVAALNEGDAAVLNQRRRLFFSGKHVMAQNAQVSSLLLPTPSLESLFGEHLYGAPSFSQRAEFRNARKQRTFSFPSTTTSSSSSHTDLTVEVVPFAPTVFEASGHAQGENAQEMIVVKVTVVPQNSDSTASSSSFDISEFLNQRLGLTPCVAVLTEIEYSGGEIVVVSEGMNEILS